MCARLPILYARLPILWLGLSARHPPMCNRGATLAAPPGSNTSPRTSYRPMLLIITLRIKRSALDETHGPDCCDGYGYILGPSQSGPTNLPLWLVASASCVRASRGYTSLPGHFLLLLSGHWKHESCNTCCRLNTNIHKCGSSVAGIESIFIDRRSRHVLGAGSRSGPLTVF